MSKKQSDKSDTGKATATAKPKGKAKAKPAKILVGSRKAWEGFKSGYGSVTIWVRSISKGRTLEASKVIQKAQLSALKNDLGIGNKDHADYETFRSFSQAACMALGRQFPLAPKKVAAKAKAAKAAKTAEATARKEVHETTEVSLEKADANMVIENLVSRLKKDQGLTLEDLQFAFAEAVKKVYGKTV